MVVMQVKREMQKNNDWGYLWVIEIQLSPSSHKTIINNVCTTNYSIRHTMFCKSNFL